MAEVEETATASAVEVDNSGRHRASRRLQYIQYRWYRWSTAPISTFDAGQKQQTVSSATADRHVPGTYKCLSKTAVTLELECDPRAPKVVHRFTDPGELLEVTEIAESSLGQQRGKTHMGWVSLVNMVGVQLFRMVQPAMPAGDSSGGRGPHFSETTLVPELVINNPLAFNKAVLDESDSPGTVVASSAAPRAWDGSDLHTLTSEPARPYPGHWGLPPLHGVPKTCELPGGFGRGSSTLAEWIQRHLDADAVEQAKRNAAACRAATWLLPLLCGVAVQQGSVWFFFYAEFQYWGGVIGATLLFVGASGFCYCVPDHSAKWREDHVYFWALICIYAFFAIGFAMIGPQIGGSMCPAMGSVPVDGVPENGPWLLPSTPTPPCTNVCHHANNSICSDGGPGSGRTRCPLGSDTADCGCRNGTTIADWLNPAQLDHGYSWADRFGAMRASGDSARTLTMMIFSLFFVLPLSLWLVCDDLVAIQGGGGRVVCIIPTLLMICLSGMPRTVDQRSQNAGKANTDAHAGATAAAAMFG